MEKNTMNPIEQLKQTIVNDIANIIKSHNRSMIEIADITTEPLNVDSAYQSFFLDRIYLNEGGGLIFDCGSASFSNEELTIEALYAILSFLENHKDKIDEFYYDKKMSEETIDTVHEYLVESLWEFFNRDAYEIATEILDDVIDDIIETADWGNYEDGEINSSDVHMAACRVITERILTNKKNI